MPDPASAKWLDIALVAGVTGQLDAVLEEAVRPTLDAIGVTAWSYLRTAQQDGLGLRLALARRDWTAADRDAAVAAFAERLPAALARAPRDGLLPLPPSQAGSAAVSVKAIGLTEPPDALDLVSSAMASAVVKAFDRAEDRIAFVLAALAVLGHVLPAPERAAFWTCHVDAVLGEQGGELREALGAEAAGRGRDLRERAAAHRVEVRRAEHLRALRDVAAPLRVEELDRAAHHVANRLGATPVEEALVALLLAADGEKEEPLAARDAVVSFGAVSKTDGETAVLEDVHLEVRRGEAFGLLGPLGAGKSTLLGLVAGLRLVDSGELEVLGEDPRTNRRALQGRVGNPLPDAELVLDVTAREQLELAAPVRGDALDGALRQVGLLGAAGRVTSELGAGERRRLGLAVALLSDPELVLCDEPAAGLAAVEREEVWQTLRELRNLGRTLIIATQSVQDALAVCDRVALVVGGRVTTVGPPVEVVGAHFPRRELHLVVGDEPDVALIRELPEVTDLQVDQRDDHWALAADTLQPDQLYALLEADPAFPAIVRVAEGDLEATFAHPRPISDPNEGQ